MKLSRTAWLTIGTGILVIGAVVLYLLYDGQMEKQQQAKETIAAAEAVLPELSSAKADREAELAQVQLELTQLEADMDQKQATFDELYPLGFSCS